MSIDYVALRKNLNKTYTIEEFNRRSESERDFFKGHICCPKCKVDAGYRKASSDGKIACFFARHVQGCPFATTSKNNSGKDGAETNRVEVDTSVFGIQWNYKSSKSSGEHEAGESSNEDKTYRNRKYVKNPIKERQAKLTLNKILTYSQINKLQEADIQININGKVQNLEDCVHHVSVINDSMLGCNAFFWGEMKYYKGNFINLRDASDVSIRIYDETLKKFDYRFRDKFFNIQKSNLMIIYGKITKTKNNKYLVNLNDINRFYCRAK
ncbi:MAG: hypothetical protein N4A40_10520 [Tissierellales bacterium]|jgi:hypothetical protein|nr:hypothetical protein [Tissierellales bacterium]